MDQLARILDFLPFLIMEFSDLVGEVQPFVLDVCIYFIVGVIEPIVAISVHDAALDCLLAIWWHSGVLLIDIFVLFVETQKAAACHF